MTLFNTTFKHNLLKVKDIKYKISFANQSANSKEARIRGVSLQY